MSDSSDAGAIFDRLPQSVKDSMFIPTPEQRARMESLPFVTWKEEAMTDDKNLPDVAATVKRLRYQASSFTADRQTILDAASLLESLSARVTQAETEKGVLLSEVDAELQQATVLHDPYVDARTPEDGRELSYRRGYRAGMGSAFTEFRHIAESHSANYLSRTAATDD
jgi:hypothetical protein